MTMCAVRGLTTLEDKVDHSCPFIAAADAAAVAPPDAHHHSVRASQLSGLTAWGGKRPYDGREEKDQRG